MSMPSIHHRLDPSKTRELFSQATPKVKHTLFGRETRTEGFATESCEDVAKRLMDHVDRESEKYATAFAELIRIKLLKDPSAKDKEIDLLMYEAFSEAFKNEFEKATYNGPTKEYAGKDLFTRPRAEAKAQRISLEITTRLLKDKRLTIRNNILEKVQSQSPHHVFTNMSFDRTRLDRDIKPTIDENRTAVLKDADTIFRETTLTTTSSQENSADKADNLATCRLNKWDDRLAGCAAMQVHFGEIINLGSSKERSGELLPKSWQDYEHRCLEAADHMCLRAITQQTIEPFFRLARLTPASAFDAFIMLETKISDRKPDEARAYYESLPVTQRQYLLELIRGIKEAIEEMPQLPIDEELLIKKQHQKHPSMSEAAKTALALELAPMIYLTSLSFVKEGLSRKSARVDNFLKTLEGSTESIKETPKAARSAPEKPVKPSKIIDPLAELKKNTAFAEELRKRLEARSADTATTEASTDFYETDEDK